MRRTLPLLLAATLLIAACSSDDDTATDATDAAETTAGDVATTDTPEGTDPAAPPTNPDKPSVDIPDEIPTELEVTVLEEGSGPEAAPGDTVIVDYVGVRSRDGVEFDNSYDRFQPFDLVLGTGSVIDGWDQGLTGVQAGSTVRIDIPSDLAYGPDANGDIIGENEALTFLIEVRAVIQPPDPADAPTEAGVPESEGAADTTFVDLREGDGPELQPGQTAVVNYVVFRGDNLVPLESSWEGGEPVSIGTAAGTGSPASSRVSPAWRSVDAAPS
jgi:peptidylprolyl isomerase